MGNKMYTRRQISKIGIGSLLGGTVAVSLLNHALAHANGLAQGGNSLAAALRTANIVAPNFPHLIFPITSYGAVGDGTTDNTEAFKKAIAACSKAGGGQVLVPEGTFLTGAIHLLSNVNLHVVAGGTILFSQNPQAYLPLVFTRWQGIELMNFSPFIYAYGQKNIAITGSGTIDGQADASHWWSFKPFENADFSVLEAMANAGTPVSQRIFGTNYHLPPTLIELYKCENVVIQGVTLKNSPFWQMHPTLCRNVLIDGVQANSLGPNNDGCDPESCNGVLIQNCTFNTGDDCIALKSGRDADGRRVNVPCQNVIIYNCTFQSGHGGITIGSEMTGGVQNVFASNLKMISPSLQYGVRIKTNSVRGGFVKNVVVDNFTITQVSVAALTIDYTYQEGDTGTFLPLVTNITLSNGTIGQAQQAWNLIGYARDPIGTVTLTNCTFTKITGTNVTDFVNNLALHNVTINGVQQ